MSPPAALGVSIRKEARALLPMFLASAGALILVAYLADRRLSIGGVLVYLFGSLALASWSIGHEYSHRTLPILLSLPATRPRLLLVKLGVVIPLLLMLSALAQTLPPSGGFGARAFPGLVGVLGIVCMVILAPLLTMLCRSPIAGVVFAPAITGCVHLLAQLAQLPTLRLWGFASVAALGAVAGWVAFMQLEAIEGLPDVNWPHGWRATPAAAPVARRRNRFWLLILKELRLQHMTFIVTVLFVLGGIAISLLSSVVPEFNGSPEPMVVLNGLMLAWLIGSLASAEERHLGTIEWQTLLPVAAWQQWIVKAGVAFALALLIALGIPLLFALDGPQFNRVYIATIVVLVTASLYVSTLCSSGLRTLTASGPAILIVFLPLGRFFRPFDPDLMSPVEGLLLASLLLLALRFGFENHRSAERDFRRVGWHVLVMTALVLALIAPTF